MPFATCPECATEIHVDEDVDKGENIFCEECETKLVVVGLDPIEVDVVTPDEEEDDDEEDDY